MIGNGLECIALCSLLLSVPPEFQAGLQGLAKVLSNGALWPAVARLAPVSRCEELLSAAIVIIHESFQYTSVDTAIAVLLSTLRLFHHCVLCRWMCFRRCGAGAECSDDHRTSNRRHVARQYWQLLCCTGNVGSGYFCQHTACDRSAMRRQPQRWGARAPGREMHICRSVDNVSSLGRKYEVHAHSGSKNRVKSY